MHTSKLLFHPQIGLPYTYGIGLLAACVAGLVPPSCLSLVSCLHRSPAVAVSCVHDAAHDIMTSHCCEGYTQSDSRSSRLAAALEQLDVESISVDLPAAENASSPLHATVLVDPLSKVPISVSSASFLGIISRL